MKYQIFFILIIFSSFLVVPCYSQISRGRNINLSVGANFNHIYVGNQDEEVGFKRLRTSPGYSIELGMDSIRIDWLRIDLALNFDQYNANFRASYSGLPGGSDSQVNINKSILGLTLYPFRIIKNNFRCQFGFEYSHLLNEHISGYVSTYLMGQGSTYNLLNEKYNRYSTITNFGIRMKVGYIVQLKNHIIISPYYSLYWTAWNEYDKASVNIKTMRNSFGLTGSVLF